MSTNTIERYHTWELLYAECISPDVGFMDDEEYQRCKKKIIEFYFDCEGIPTVTEIFFRAYDYNYDVISRGITVEINENPEFRFLKKMLVNDRKQAEKEVEETIEGMMQTFSYYALYDFIVGILCEENMCFEMFDTDDFQYAGEIEAADVFGKGSKVIINDCQNVLIQSYKKIPTALLNYVPRTIIGKLSVLFEEPTYLKMLKIGGNNE